MKYKYNRVDRRCLITHHQWSSFPFSRDKFRSRSCGVSDADRCGPGP